MLPPSHHSSRPEPCMTVVLISSGLFHVASATHPNAVGTDLSDCVSNQPGRKYAAVPYPEYH